MDKIKLVLIIMIVSLFISGCVDENGDVTPVSTPVVTETEASTPAVTAVTAVTVAPTPEPTPVRQSVSFKSYVDGYYGFRKMVKINPEERPVYDYKNRTLTIYAGDTVIWVNDADPEEKLTIVSEEGLWDNTSAILRWSPKQFSYTFTDQGVYGVYIKEYPRIRHQKIIVNP